MAGPAESCRGAIEVDLTRQLHRLFTSAVCMNHVEAVYLYVSTCGYIDEIVLILSFI